MTAATDTFTADRVFDIIGEILARRSADRPIRPILRDDDLSEAGLTSLEMVSLMLSVEAEFGLKIPDADMTLRNFRSISAIAALASRFRGNDPVDHNRGASLPALPDPDMAAPQTN